MADTLSAGFVVIGSGIIGSLAARKLAQAGASAVILEAGPRVTRGELVARFRKSPRDQAARLRNGGSPSHVPLLARLGIAAVFIALIVAFVLLVRYRRKSV